MQHGPAALAQLLDVDSTSVFDLVKAHGFVVAVPTTWGGFEIKDIFLVQPGDYPDQSAAKNAALTYIGQLNGTSHIRMAVNQTPQPRSAPCHLRLVKG